MTLIDPFVAVIPAAGVGKRLGSKESKQYLLLRGQSILESSIKPLLHYQSAKEYVSLLVQRILIGDL